jgi:hypothetical protein
MAWHGIGWVGKELVVGRKKGGRVRGREGKWGRGREGKWGRGREGKWGRGR